MNAHKNSKRSNTVLFWAVAMVIGLSAQGYAYAAGSSQSGGDKAIATVVETGERVGHKTLRLIKLVDGTRCIVLTSNRSAALDCDWAPRNTRSKPAPGSRPDSELDLNELIRQ